MITEVKEESLLEQRIVLTEERKRKQEKKPLSSQDQPLLP